MIEVAPKDGEPTRRVWESAPGGRVRSRTPRLRGKWHVFAVVVLGVAATAVVVGAGVDAVHRGARDARLASQSGRGPAHVTASLMVEQHGPFTVRAQPLRLQTHDISYSGTISASTADRSLFGDIDLTLSEDFHLPSTSARPNVATQALGGGTGVAADVGHRRAHPDLLQDPKQFADSSHIWGTASATLGGVACEGPLAFSSYPGSGDGGGAFAFRCRDGSVIGGELRPANVPGATPSGWKATLELTGFYIAGD